MLGKQCSYNLKQFQALDPESKTHKNPEIKIPAFHRSPSLHQQDRDKSERGGSQLSESKSNSALHNVNFACHGNMRRGFHRVWVGVGPALARHSPLAEMFCGEGARDSGGILAQLRDDVM